MKKLIEIVLGLLAGSAVSEKIASELKLGISPLAPYLRRISMGVVLIMLSVLSWFSGLFFLLITLFVYLSDLSQFVVPALFTSLTCFLIGCIFVFFGFRLVRKPR